MIAAVLVREEWPLVGLGLGIGLLWTIASVLVAVQLNELVRADSVLGAARIVGLFPSIVAAWIGETAYRAGLPGEALSLLGAWIVASMPLTTALLTLARRS